MQWQGLSLHALLSKDTGSGLLPCYKFSWSSFVKAKVYVTLKSGVLDPQGKAIQHSVELLGFDGIADVRQGKYFEIALDGSLDEEDARQAANRMAREVLSNPVIEDYRVEIE
jgi:phosphoribosylformylglycinamidine synthase subunit PurS